jgi:hypothetical protein
MNAWQGVKAIQVQRFTVQKALAENAVSIYRFLVI